MSLESTERQRRRRWDGCCGSHSSSSSSSSSSSLSSTPLFLFVVVVLLLLLLLVGTFCDFSAATISVLGASERIAVDLVETTAKASAAKTFLHTATEAAPRINAHKNNNTFWNVDAAATAVALHHHEGRRREEEQQEPQQKEEEQQKQDDDDKDYYFLTLLIKFDDYAQDVGWKLKLQNGTTLWSVLPQQQAYGGHRAGKVHLQDFAVDPYLGNETQAFRFTMMDSHRDGFRRGGYFQLNFTNRLVGRSTEISRGSRYGRRATVTFTIGSRPFGKAHIVQAVVRRRVPLSEAPTPSPVAPPSLPVGTAFLRITFDFAGTWLDWAVYTLNAQTLNRQARVDNGRYRGRQDGILYFTVPLQRNTYYEFSLRDATPFSTDFLANGYYSVTFVPAASDQRDEDKDETPQLILSSHGNQTQRQRHVLVMFRVSSDQNTVQMVTRSPTAAPFIAPTAQPTTKQPTRTPSFQPTPEPTGFRSPILADDIWSRQDDENVFDFAGALMAFCLFLAGCAFCWIAIKMHCRDGQREAAADHDNNNSSNGSNTTMRPLQPEGRNDFHPHRRRRQRRLAANPQRHHHQHHQHHHQQQQRSRLGGLPPEERRRYIRDNLLAIPIGSVSDGAAMSECAICLMEYRDGDVICFSCNSICEHKFHRDCMVAWLQNHEECPCCRQPYLQEEDRAEC